MSRHALLAAGAAAVLLPLVLTGCSGTAGWLPRERHGVAESPRRLALAWSTPATQPAWLPQDATRIRWIAATRGGADRAPAALLADSAEPLPATCRPARHHEDAAIAASWTPRHATRVLRCGGWAVTAVDGGYYAWTPVDPDAVG